MCYFQSFEEQRFGSWVYMPLLFNMYLKHILECQKFQKNKCCPDIFTTYVCTKPFKKQPFFVDYVKKLKIGAKISCCTRHICLFTQSIKLNFLYETLVHT
jgi:hypothetical protein